MIASHKIDIEKSKLNNKIYLKKNAFQNIFSFVFRCFVTLLLPANTILYLIENYQDFNNDVFGYVMMNLAAVIIAFFIYKSFTFNNWLKRFNGKDLSLNKSAILKIADNLNWDIIYNEQEIITLSIDNNNQAIIIFDNKDLLININKDMKYVRPSLVSAAITAFKIKDDLLLAEKLSAFFKKIEALAPTRLNNDKAVFHSEI